MAGLEGLPWWVLAIIAVGLLLVVPAATKARELLRSEVVNDRDWWTEVEATFEQRIGRAIEQERTRTAEALKAEGLRCDMRVDLIERGWSAQVDALNTQVSMLKDQQVRLLAELSASAPWESRAWGMRELALGGGIDKATVDELWLVAGERRKI